MKNIIQALKDKLTELTNEALETRHKDDVMDFLHDDPEYGAVENLLDIAIYIYNHTHTEPYKDGNYPKRTPKPDLVELKDILEGLGDGALLEPVGVEEYKITT